MRVAGLVLCLPLSCAPKRAHEALPSASVTTSAASASSSVAPSASASAPAFREKRPARAGEWLREHTERPQSFDAYRAGNPIRPSATRHVIVLQPIGAFDAKQTALVGKMRAVMEAFFGLSVEMRPAVALPRTGFRKRDDGGRSYTQHHTRVLLDDVLAPRVPAHAVVYVGVTMTDLYPEPAWNFVFGEATFEKRVGVYSLARFFPEFWGETSSPETDRHAFVKGSQILVHETTHAFSLPHCTEYECVMNGINSMNELDGAFGELCPICLKKLAWNVGFDTAKRYAKLRDVYRREGAHELADWFAARVDEPAR